MDMANTMLPIEGRRRLRERGAHLTRCGRPTGDGSPVSKAPIDRGWQVPREAWDSPEPLGDPALDARYPVKADGRRVKGGEWDGEATGNATLCGVRPTSLGAVWMDLDLPAHLKRPNGTDEERGAFLDPHRGLVREALGEPDLVLETPSGGEHWAYWCRDHAAVADTSLPGLGDVKANRGQVIVYLQDRFDVGDELCALVDAAREQADELPVLAPRIASLEARWGRRQGGGAPPGANGKDADRAEGLEPRRQKVHERLGVQWPPSRDGVLDAVARHLAPTGANTYDLVPKLAHLAWHAGLPQQECEDAAVAARQGDDEAAVRSYVKSAYERREAGGELPAWRTANDWTSRLGAGVRVRLGFEVWPPSRAEVRARMEKLAAPDDGGTGDTVLGLAEAAYHAGMTREEVVDCAVEARGEAARADCRRTVDSVYDRCAELGEPHCMHVSAAKARRDEARFWRRGKLTREESVASAEQLGYPETWDYDYHDQWKTAVAQPPGFPPIRAPEGDAFHAFKSTEKDCTDGQVAAAHFYDQAAARDEELVANLVYLHPRDGQIELDPKRLLRYRSGQGWVPVATELMPHLKEFGSKNLMTWGRDKYGKPFPRALTREGGRPLFAKETMVSLAALPEVACYEDEFDRDPCLFGLADGTVLDLRSGALVPAPASATVRLKAGGVLVDDTAELEALVEALVPDEQDLEAFWTWVGAAAFHGQLNRRVMLLWGPTGTGKTTLVNLLRRAFGGYGEPTLHQLIVKDGKGGSLGATDDFTKHSALHKLQGKRLATIDDMPAFGHSSQQQLTWNDSTFLSVIGGGTVAGRGRGKDTEFVGGFSVVAATNTAPAFAEQREQAQAQAERLLAVRMPYKGLAPSKLEWLRSSSEAVSQMLTCIARRAVQGARVGDSFPLSRSTWRLIVEGCRARGVSARDDAREKA